MSVKLNDTSSVADKRSVKSVGDKVKIKFNVSTMMILDTPKFNTELGADTKNFRFYPEPSSYKHFRSGQVLELEADEFAKFKSYYGDRTVSVNNERMGNLQKIYKERMQSASPSEKIYIEANKHEFTACTFQKPIIEIVD